MTAPPRDRPGVACGFCAHPFHDGRCPRFGCRCDKSAPPEALRRLPSRAELDACGLGYRPGVARALRIQTRNAMIRRAFLDGRRVVELATAFHMSHVNVTHIVNQPEYRRRGRRGNGEANHGTSNNRN